MTKRKFWEPGQPYTWYKLRIMAFERDNYTCQMCNKKFDSSTQLIGDHIIAISDGGDEFDLDNIQTLCRRCNRKKTIEESKARKLKSKSLEGK